DPQPGAEDPERAAADRRRRGDRGAGARVRRLRRLPGDRPGRAGCRLGEAREVTMPPSVIHTLVGAIPAEEGASYVAHVGEPGRISSRAGSVHLGSAPLTVAAIDE